MRECTARMLNYHIDLVWKASHYVKKAGSSVGADMASMQGWVAELGKVLREAATY